MKASSPVDHELPGHNWDLKKLKQWLRQVWGREVGRSTLRALLKRHRLSWKKCQKLLKKANPAKRAAFIAAFQELYEQVCRGEIILLYLDQSHFHRDMDLGYTWSTVGEVAWRPSNCPPLSDRINWYGAYNINQGECFIWNEGSCNKETTVRFLRRLAEWVGTVDRPSDCTGLVPTLEIVNEDGETQVLYYPPDPIHQEMN